MISYTKLVLSLLFAATSVAVAGYGFFIAENCYGVARDTGRCYQIGDYVVEWLGMAGFYIGFYIVTWGVRQRWKSLLDKRMVLVFASAGAVAGGVLADATYYLTRAAGLVVPDYPTCGGYSMPLGCFTFNPFVPIWFIFTGCTTGFGALLIFAVKRGEIKSLG